MNISKKIWYNLRMQILIRNINFASFIILNGMLPNCLKTSDLVCFLIKKNPQEDLILKRNLIGCWNKLGNEDILTKLWKLLTWFYHCIIVERFLLKNSSKKNTTISQKAESRNSHSSLELNKRRSFKSQGKMRRKRTIVFPALGDK